MIRLLAILAALASADQAVVAPQGTAGEKAPEVKDLRCPPRPGYEPRPTGPLDLSRQGLVFDPITGARPRDPEPAKSAPVNPGAVILFPVPSTDTILTPKKPDHEGEDLEQDPHRCP